MEISDENNPVIKLLDKPNPYCDNFDLFSYLLLSGLNRRSFWYLNFVGKSSGNLGLYPQFMKVNREKPVSKL